MQECPASAAGASRIPGPLTLDGYGMPPLIYRFSKPKPGSGHSTSIAHSKALATAAAAAVGAEEPPPAGDGELIAITSNVPSEAPDITTYTSLQLIDFTSNVPSKAPDMAPSDEVTKDLAGLTFETAPQAGEHTYAAPSKEPADEGDLIAFKPENTRLWNRLHELGDYDTADDSSIGTSHPPPSSHGPWSKKSSSHGLPRIPVLLPTKSAASSPRFPHPTFTNSSASVRITPSTTSAGVTLPRIFEHRSVNAPPPRPSNLALLTRKNGPEWLQTNAADFLAAQREHEERQKRERAAGLKPLLIDYSDDKGKGKETELAAPAERAQPTTTPAPTAGFPSGPSREPAIGQARVSPAAANEDERYDFW
ncbi:MAG: hypothetical protein Q9196_003969 [Gyalolechia fulgens]